MLSEIIEQGVDKLDVPNISIDGYMEHIKGPDFPTGAGIHGIDGIRHVFNW